MLAQLSPYRNCAVLPLKEEGRSHSTMLWTHFGRWTPVQTETSSRYHRVVRKRRIFSRGSGESGRSQPLQ